MKKLIIIILIVLTKDSFSQSITNATIGDSCLWAQQKKMNYINKILRRSDSVFIRQCGAWVFAFKDSVGSGGGGSSIAVSDSAWMKGGNDNITYGQSIGTINNRSLWVKTNGIRKFVFDSTGKFGIGVPFGSRPVALFDIWTATGADTAIIVFNIFTSNYPFIVKGNGEIYATGYKIYDPASSTLHSESGTFGTVVNTERINSDGGSGSPLTINGGGYTAGVGIGGIPDTKSLLDLQSTTKGFLPPRMTTTQMNAVSSPPTGLQLFNSTAGQHYTYNGSAFVSTGVISGSFSQVGTATTTFTVTFGGTQPNTTYKVNVTPTAGLSAALFYVTNKTTTTFDVMYLAGLTGTVTFDYSIYQ